ncbi:MAG: hypothetical protein ACLFVJ_09430, partial [Persicimonas sp.]
TNPVIKTVWVSMCPGGEPLMVSEGYQSATLHYSGGSNEDPPYYLIEGKEYYFNVMNARKDTPEQSTCEEWNCSFAMAHY